MRIVLFSALLATSIFAQRSSGGQGHGASAPAPAPRMHSAPSGPSRPVGPPGVARPPYAPRPYQPGAYFVPFPVFVGSGPGPLGDDSGLGYSNPAPESAPAPVGIVNQDFRPDAVNPSIVDFSNVPPPGPDSAADAGDSALRDDQPTIYLIALTDHTVVAAIAYWVDGDTLNWVSRDAKQNRMSLSLVDRDFSKQLNDERRVDFRLPPLK